MIDWNELGYRRLPRAMPREDADPPVTNAASCAAAFADDAVVPDSGGLVGDRAIARRVGLTERRARDTILRESWVRSCGWLRATHQASADAWRVANQERVRAAHAQCGRFGGTDPSSGSALLK